MRDWLGFFLSGFLFGCGVVYKTRIGLDRKQSQIWSMVVVWALRLGAFCVLGASFIRAKESPFFHGLIGCVVLSIAYALAIVSALMVNNGK